MSRQERPIIPIPRSRLSRVLNFITVVGLVVILAIAIHGWLVLPDRIPIHFNFAGEPNGWGGKSNLWLVPAIAIFFSVGLTCLSRYPQIFNYPVEITPENAARQYQMACSLLNWLKVEMVWIFAYSEWLMYDLAISKPTASAWLSGPLLVLVITVFITIGFYLRQAFLIR